MIDIKHEKVQLFIKLLQMKKLHLLTLIALIMISLSGCEKAKVTNGASADVFVKAIKNAQGITVYTAVHSVFSYNTMTSVSVTSPTGTVTQLIDYGKTGMSFYNEPTDADYSPTPPSMGTYTYSVTFNDGEVISYNNSLSSSTLLPSVITSLAKSADGDSVYIKFNAIANVNFYQVEVTKGTTQIYYSDKFYDGSSPLKTNLSLGFNITNLISAGGSGTFTFNINGLLYETTLYDYLQATSTASSDIVL